MDRKVEVEMAAKRPAITNYSRLKGFLPNLESIAGAFSRLGFIRLKISHGLFLEIAIISLTMCLALMIRLLPLRWGFYISEFDPYFHYHISQYIVKNGLPALSTWHDYSGFYPYGRQVIKTAFPGLPITLAIVYTVVHTLIGTVTLYDCFVLFPVVMGSLGCLAIYFFGKDFGSKTIGLFSMFFLALNSSYISRTALGFCDDESIGIFMILLLSLFFLRSLDKERSLNKTVLYSIAAGLSLGYISTFWGAVRYPIAMLTLFVFVLLILKRYSRRLLLSYSVTFGIAFLIAINVPKLGTRFLFEAFNLPVIGVFLLMLLIELLQNFKKTSTKLIFTLGFVAFIIAAAFLLLQSGMITLPFGKFMGALNPLTRLGNPLVSSVAEHRPSAWGTFYSAFGIGAFFIPLGLFFAVQNPTNRNVYVTIFGLSSLYFASSMVRLMLIAAPAICLLWAIALDKLLKPFVAVLKEAQRVQVGRRRFQIKHVGKEFSVVVFIFIFLLLTVNFVTPTPRVYDESYAPTTIAAASLPLRPQTTVSDWITTLEWMRTNLPPGTVVVSWWDYGDWITVLGNQTTVVDNTTMNKTQIQQVALMFMSNETEAIKILQRYNASYVVVFASFTNTGEYTGWGDDGKWMWMARIAGLNETDFGDYEDNKWVWNEKGKNTVIYKLMEFAKEFRTKPGETPTVTLEYFLPAYISRGSGIQFGNTVVFATVAVYKVVIPQES